MSWIEVVDDTTWDGELGDLRNRVVDPGSGRVDHIMSVHSLNPRGMAAHDAVYRSAMRGTATLRKVERELIAFVVSQINGCHY
jgi:alkylhydroperoxidase family enzyme